MIAYCPHCRASVHAYYRDAAVRRLAQHTAENHPDVNGGVAVTRPHPTTTPTEGRQQ